MNQIIFPKSRDCTFTMFIFIIITINTSCITNSIEPTSLIIPSTITPKQALASTLSSTITPEFTNIRKYASPTNSYLPTITNTQTASITNSQQYDWINLGPEGGNIYIVAIDPVMHTTIYASSRTHLFRSVDDGGHWYEIDLETITDRNIVELVIDPSTPNTLYMVSREENIDILYKSTNGGEVWNKLETNDVIRRVLTIVVNVKYANTLYIGCENGIYKSNDGGESWNHLGLKGISVYEIALDR